MTPNQLAHLRVEIPFSRKRTLSWERMCSMIELTRNVNGTQQSETSLTPEDEMVGELRHATGAQTALMLDISYCLCFSCINGRNWCRANRTANNSRQLICLCSQGPVQEPLAYSTPALSEGICCNINYALQATTPRGARFFPNCI